MYKYLAKAGQDIKILFPDDPRTTDEINADLKAQLKEKLGGKEVDIVIPKLTTPTASVTSNAEPTASDSSAVSSAMKDVPAAPVVTLADMYGKLKERGVDVDSITAEEKLRGNGFTISLNRGTESNRALEGRVRDWAKALLEATDISSNNVTVNQGKIHISKPNAAMQELVEDLITRPRQTTRA